MRWWWWHGMANTCLSPGCCRHDPSVSSGLVSTRTRSTASPSLPRRSASSAVKTTLPQAAPGDAGRPSREPRRGQGSGPRADLEVEWGGGRPARVLEDRGGSVERVTLGADMNAQGSGTRTRVVGADSSGIESRTSPDDRSEAFRVRVLAHSPERPSQHIAPSACRRGLRLEGSPASFPWRSIYRGALGVGWGKWA